jgi:curved DNA-binding protein CbpA
MPTDKKPLEPHEVQFIREMHRAATAGTLYDVLGMHGSSTPAEVEAAYMEIARRWHPDRFYSRDVADLGSVIDENFAVASRAYRTLRDPVKRSAYDREIVAAGTPPPPSPRGVTSPSVTSPTSGERNRPPTDRTRPASGERPIPERPAAERATPAPPPEPAHETSFRPSSMPEIPKPKPKAPPAVAKHMQAIFEQRRKAEAHFVAGKAEFDAGQYGKAESALYLAMTIDKGNAAYRDLYEQARARARDARSRQLAQQADNVLSFGKTKEAIQLLKQVVESDPPEGMPFYKLALLIRNNEPDDRAVLGYLRKAAQKEPKNVMFRMALGEMYASLNLKANAMREVQAVLELEPRNDAARALLKKLK